MTQNPGNKAGKVLVVDDNLLNRKLACAVLKGCKLEFDVAENGKIAYEKYLSGEFMLILMDIQMPICNGIEATKLIRKAEAESGKRIPIIAVTTFSMRTDMKNCFEAGMNELLAKPYKTTELIEVMAKYIDIPVFPDSKN